VFFSFKKENNTVVITFLKDDICLDKAILLVKQQ
jgi:hypothetical protein